MRFLFPVLALLLGCADFSGGGAGTGGTAGIVDPEPITKTIDLGCTNTLIGQLAILEWELTVNPGPIVSGEPFAADFNAIAVFHEVFMDFAQLAVPGGVTRVRAPELQGTVHAREGTIRETPDEDDVVLTLALAEVGQTCRYDNNGNIGIGAGPFPACSQENDDPDGSGSNEDCIGLGDVPSPENPCGQFFVIPTSDDCAPGGVCDSLPEVEAGFGIVSKRLQCETNGFCVKGPAEGPLEGSRADFKAAASGTVLFGWDDENTGAELDQTGGPNHGTWILPGAVFDASVGPNGLRIIVGEDAEIALECTMGVHSLGADGVDSRNDLLSPAANYRLISFPIQMQ